MTVYQKGNRTRMLRQIALWDGKEVKITGTYTGLFPKLHGGHDIQGRFLNSFVDSILYNKLSHINLILKSIFKLSQSRPYKILFASNS